MCETHRDRSQLTAAACWIQRCSESVRGHQLLGHETWWGSVSLVQQAPPGIQSSPVVCWIPLVPFWLNGTEVNFVKMEGLESRTVSWQWVFLFFLCFFFFYSDLRKSINGLRVLSFLSTKNNPTPTRDEVGLNILLMNILLNRLSLQSQLGRS